MAKEPCFLGQGGKRSQRVHPNAEPGAEKERHRYQGQK